MTRSRFHQIFESFSRKRILVIGDLMLDEFIWGNVKRISPEAPVPVVEVERESYFPGGAANVARNLREFAGDVHVMGLIGTDSHAEHLKQLLAGEGINLDCIQQDPAYQTIVKTRIIARQQQVVRVDREKKTALTPLQTERAVAQVEKILPGIDAIIIEDYAKGLLHQDFVDAITALAQRSGKILAVDPNPSNVLQWNGVSVIKPNRTEAFAAAGLPASDPVEPVTGDRHLLEVGAILSKKWRTENLLITLGEHGMLLFAGDSAPYHTPTLAREVFDVSGAGDTAIALFTLALCSGATAPEAAEISNHASGIVVGKLGTATVTPAELIESFENHTNERQ
jgi:D-beta-D-heptose 7-phosphate kinase/D-beta-D-heptose 1-phosphate adenosyltransferase